MKKSKAEPITIAQCSIDSIHETIQDKFDSDSALSANEVLVYLIALADEWGRESNAVQL